MMTYVTEHGAVTTERDSGDPAPLYYWADGKIAVTTGGPGGGEGLVERDDLAPAVQEALERIDYTYEVLCAEYGDATLSIRVPEEAAPLVLDEEGREIRDYGLAEYPSDAEIAAEATRLLGRPVEVKFLDKGDDLLEAIYSVRELAKLNDLVVTAAGPRPSSCLPGGVDIDVQGRFRIDPDVLSPEEE